MHTPFALLDDATAQGNSRLYCNLQQTDYIHSVDVVNKLDGQLRSGWQKGWYALLLAPYEHGYAFHGMCPPQTSKGPLQDDALRLLWFETCEHLSDETVNDWLNETDLSDAPAGITRLSGEVNESEYCTAVNRIQQLIAAGDTYQVNYTYRMRGQAFGDPLRLYRTLRAAQPVPYGALICLPGDEWILSLSPELFVRHDGQGILTAQPMKGTAPLSGHIENDRKAAQTLAADAKNRAENVMIVDLLRNDLGQIAMTGSVTVPALFSVNPFGKVLQMTSTVTAQASQPLNHATLWQALFPCGSITGAPKRRTMQIIHDIENSPRGMYTGAIGWIDPPDQSDLPGAFCLSVAIRTLVLTATDEQGWRQAELGIGSGIVADSIARDEHAECGWKSRFLREHDPDFGLIETMRIERGWCQLIDGHLSRLSLAAEQLGFLFDELSIRNRIAAYCAQLDPRLVWRLKLVLFKSGHLTLQHGELTTLPGPVLIDIAPQALPVADPLRTFKTTHRHQFDTAWRQAEQKGAFDSLFFNKRNELLEGGRSTVFIKQNGCWLTPPLQLDVLPGVMRAQILNEKFPLDAPVQEAVITRDMINQADALALSNALRGWIPAQLIYQ